MRIKHKQLQHYEVAVTISHFSRNREKISRPVGGGSLINCHYCGKNRKHSLCINIALINLRIYKNILHKRNMLTKTNPQWARKLHWQLKKIEEEVSCLATVGSPASVSKLGDQLTHVPCDPKKCINATKKKRTFAASPERSGWNKKTGQFKNDALNLGATAPNCSDWTLYSCCTCTTRAFSKWCDPEAWTRLFL